MAHDAPPVDLEGANVRLGAAERRFGETALIVGAACLGGSLLLSLLRGGDGLRYFMHSYLSAFAFGLAPTLGALFFVMVQRLVRAGWSMSLIRVAELLALNFKALAVLALPIVAYAFLTRGSAELRGHAAAEGAGAAHAKGWFEPGALYPWTNAALAEHNPSVKAKAPYLNFWFWALRIVGYFAAWIFLAGLFHGKSVEQDRTRDRRVNQQLENAAAPGMFAFALTLTFAAIDFLMTLLPTWYSTMWGVYYFAGAAWSFFAVLILTLLLLQKCGRLQGVVTVEHYHDLGKFLFGFTFFWGYIAFSQYMLYWYANIPEETEFMRIRQFVDRDGSAYGPWMHGSLALLFLHFIIPFPGLLSRHAKRKLPVLAFWACFALAVQAVDLHWLVMPNWSNATNTLHEFPLRASDLLCPVGVLALLAAAFVRNAGRVPLVAVGEPRLGEALAFKNF